MTGMLEHSAAAFIAAEFELGPVTAISGPVARGEQGEIYRLDTSEGSWAVKLPFHVPDADTEDAEFQSAARAFGVPAPAVRALPAGGYLLQVHGRQVRVHEWIDMADPDPWLDPVTIGELAARLHRVPFVGSRSMDPWYHQPVGEIRWRTLLAGLTAAGAPFAAALAGLVDDLVAMERLIDTPTRLRTCHCDLFSDNVRATDATGSGIVVIDWDNCGPADPAQELCLLLYDFGCEEPDRQQALYRGYVEAGGPARIEGPADFSMLVAQLGHINERACARWLAAGPGDPERDRMAALFGEFTDRPLTPAAIHEMLAAIGRAG